MKIICKISGGIIGITQNDPARDRFCTTWAERFHVSNATKVLFGLSKEEEAISTRNDALPSREKRDNEEVLKSHGYL